MWLFAYILLCRLSRSSSTKTELKGDLKDVNDAKLKYKMERDELRCVNIYEIILF